MIIRIVKMAFEPTQVNSFKILFEENKNKISSFEGCLHLDLLQDLHVPNQFFTYSHWKSEACLEKYRSSDLFKNIWSATKVKFNQQPKAWSLLSV